MGKYPSSAALIASGSSGLQPHIAASLKRFRDATRLLFQTAISFKSAAYQFISSAPGQAAALAGSLGRPRRASMPLLQFSVASASDTIVAEPDDWAKFASRRDAVVQQALRLEDLQASAAISLDAADYALLRMRLELIEIASSLVTDLPTVVAQDRYTSMSTVLAARAV